MGSPLPRVTIERELAARIPDGGFVWALEPDVASPWGALRAMLAQARQTLGDGRTMQAMRPHLALLSLCLRDLDAELAPQERALRESVRGLRVATLPGVVSRPRALTRAFVETMVALLPARGSVIAIPDAARLDLESLRAIRPLLRAARGRSELEVRIGHDPTEPRPSDSLDALRRSLVEREMRRIEALSCTTVATEAERADASPPCRHPLDDDLVGALRTLAAGERPESQMLLAAARAAFDAYGFEAALRLARALAGCDIDDETRREAHALAALSCHNLAPLGRASDWTVAFMQTHFAAALEGEPDPCRRSHYLYRLGMLEARARGRIAEALAFGDRAVAEAIAARDGHAEAWARNGRAYARLRARELEGAARDCEAGLAALENDSAAPATCVLVARVLVANNRARLAEAMEDRGALSRFRDLAQRHFDAIVADERPSHVWLTPPEDLGDLSPTLAHHRARVEQACDELDPEAEAVACHQLALCLYRLGEAAEAAQGFRRALDLLRTIGADAADLATLLLNASVSAFRSGDLEGAERGFSELLRNELFASQSSQAELRGALSMIAAARPGGAALALEYAAEALVQAEQADEHDVLLRVLRSIAEAHLALGRRSDAAASLERALGLADDATAAEDLLGVLVGALETGSTDLELAMRALALVPRALADPNAWWELPRLLHAVAALVESHALAADDPRLMHAVAAGRQRRDCRAFLKRSSIGS